MKHGIRTSAHRDIQCHRIHKGLTGCNISRKNTLVAILVISKGILHHLTGSSLKEFYTIGMGRKDGAVTRQRESDSLCERVHRVGRKHTRTAAASRTSTTFYLLDFFVCYRGIGTLHHRRNQVSILATPLTSLHRTAGTEHRRDVQTHGCHQHTWSYLITIGDTDHRICLVGVDHILHAVGNNISAGKRVKHTVMSHRDTIIDSYGIKLCSEATHLLNLSLYNLTYLMQMGMTWHKLGE